MSTLFPGAKDDNTTLPNPTAANPTNNPSHSSQHANVNDAIKAVEGKLGTGASVPAANTLLIGTGAGTSSWSALTSAQLAAILSDETGTGLAVFGTTPTLVTPKIDTINEATGGNGTTVGGVNLKSGAITTASSVPTAAIQNNAVDYTKVTTGFLVQQAIATFTTAATGTTTIPRANTNPTSSQGDQYMTLAFTPKATTNVLIIEANAMLSHSASTVDLVATLFQDAGASALAAGNQFANLATEVKMVPLLYTMPAGTVSSTTFKVRCGGHSVGTLSFNAGVGVTPIYGTAIKSWIKISEYKV